VRAATNRRVTHAVPYVGGFPLRNAASTIHGLLDADGVTTL